MVCCRKTGVHFHECIADQDDIHHPRLVFEVNPKGLSVAEYCKFVGYKQRELRFYKRKPSWKLHEDIDKITEMGVFIAIEQKRYKVVPSWSKEEKMMVRRLKLLSEV